MTLFWTTVGANWSEGLSTYIEIFSPKKTGFSPVKNTSQIFFFLLFLTFILCNFSVRTKFFFEIFEFCLWIHKNGSQKLLIIGPKLFFHKYGPAAQTSPELIFHIINMSQDSSESVSLSVDKMGSTRLITNLVLSICRNDCV